MLSKKGTPAEEFLCSIARLPYYSRGLNGWGEWRVKKTAKAKILVPVCVLLAAATITIAAQPAKPKRINQAIELLAQGQPIYYAGSHSGTAGTYEQGVKDAQTYADYISYDMEHAPYDVKGLQEYMRGLVGGGPDRSGHRTPAVIVNVPVNGLDAAAVHANAWICLPTPTTRVRFAPL
jgi:hypothetical protein